MFTRKFLASGIAMVLGAPLSAFGADSADIERIRAEIQSMKQSYEARIAALEQQLRQLEPRPVAGDAGAPAAVPAPVTAEKPAPPVAPNAFNPEISLVLSGTYARLSQNPEDYRITGFVTGGEIGPGGKGFNLGESELRLGASVDPYFRGWLTLAITPENELEVEEAAIQATALGHGTSVTAGRFLSSIGYLNSKHAHTWDFVSAPLPYQAFLGGQYINDGAQVKWLAPTDLFVELGAEAGNGSAFPGSPRNSNGVGAYALYAHLGGDADASNSWRAGLSLLDAKPQGRPHEAVDISGNWGEHAFSGTSRLWIADFVWKWAPGGDASRRNFQLQGEYFLRQEDGELNYADIAGNYHSRQSGWYAEGVWQFMPRWRTGLRLDRLDTGSVDYGVNSANLVAPDYRPERVSLMFDYAPSEFSLLRLQLTQDRARQDIIDNQLFLQYIMSLGAHGAHAY